MLAGEIQSVAALSHASMQISHTQAHSRTPCSPQTLINMCEVVRTSVVCSGADFFPAITQLASKQQAPRKFDPNNAKQRSLCGKSVRFRVVGTAVEPPPRTKKPSLSPSHSNEIVLGVVEVTTTRPARTEGRAVVHWLRQRRERNKFWPMKRVSECQNARQAIPAVSPVEMWSI